MFKLAVFTDEVSQDFARVLKFAADYELEGIEVRSVWDKPPQDLSDDDTRKVKEMLEGTGLEVCSIASPFFKCDIDSEEECHEHLDILKRCIALGKTFDCDIIRGFAFWNKGDLEGHWQRILDRFEEPIKILEAEDVTLALENEHSTFLQTGAHVRKFLEALGNDHLKAIWDPCNVLFAPEAGEVPFPDGYQAVKDHTVHIHVKDARISPKTGERVQCAMCEGDIDYVGQFQALLDDGYGGYVSLETHWRAEDLAEEEIQLPGGEKFSKGAELASRICMNNIKKMLAALTRPEV